MPRKYDKTITDSQLEGLAAIGLSTKELCDLLGVQPSWFVESKQAILDKGRSRLRQSLRRQQIKTALAGNATMQIWLGKQYLSQTEHASMTVQAAASSLLVTPTVLEQLQQSYTLTLEEIRTTRKAISNGSEAGGAPVDRHPLPKTDHLCNSIRNDTVANGDAGPVLDSEHIRTVDNGAIECDLVNHRVDYVDADYDVNAGEVAGVAVNGAADGEDCADADLPGSNAGVEREEIEEERERIHRKIQVEDFVPAPGKAGRPKGSLTRKSKEGVLGPKKGGRDK